MRALPLFIVLMLSACADLPEVEATISPASQAAPYPDLVPLAPLLASVPPPDAPPELRTVQRPPASTPANLSARADALKEKAQALQDAPL